MAGIVDGNEKTAHGGLSLLSLSDETVAATLDGEQDSDEIGPYDEAEPLDRVGRYLVIDELGAGAMGVVYAAYDPDLDRKLAIKLLHDDEHSRDRTIRLLREAQALARVSHPNVIQVYDVGAFEERVYIAMEFIDGVALTDWLAAERRPLQTILHVFLAAGRGLEAAHKKGLVHRDFKPDNVLVARDGRVVVLDFGIAHAVAEIDRRDHESDVARSRLIERSTNHSLMASKDSLVGTLGGEGSEISGVIALDTEVTRAGAIIGTPAYMAPEQLEARETDARTDQFSFCVALWQAIHGERPYTGTNPLELWQAMCKRDMRAPKARVPNSVHKALVRGLSIESDERFPDMGALLAILERDPAAIRKRVGLGLAGAAAVAFGLWGYLGKAAPEPVCAGAEQRLAGTWDVERRADLEQAFAVSELPLADQALPGIVEGLDAYATSWRAAYTDACEATRVRGEQSEDLLDLRMACLEDRRLALDALVEVLLEPDATVIENGFVAVAKLRPIDACADQARLRARVPPPDDPALADRVEHIERELARARARRDAGDYERALIIAKEAQSQASKTDYAPIEAAALTELGNAMMDSGIYDASTEQPLREGFYRALAGGDEEAAIEAATALVQLNADRQQDFEAAHTWFGIADGILDRQHDQSSRARVELQYLLGVLRWREGELEQSRTDLEAAIELASRLGEDEILLENRVRKGLGSTLWSLGKHEEAAEQFQLVVDTLARELGPGHPSVGSALNNLASTYYALGKLELAEQEFLRTLGIYELSYGDDHPSVANSLNNLAVVYTKRGKLEQARDTHLRVLAINEKALGPAHPELANTWSNLARVLRRLHDYEGAADYYRRAYDLRREVFGPDNSDTMTSLGDLATSLADLAHALVADKDRKSVV